MEKTKPKHTARAATAPPRGRTLRKVLCLLLAAALLLTCSVPIVFAAEDTSAARNTSPAASLSRIPSAAHRAARATEYERDGFKYTLNGNDATITGYVGSETNVTISESLDGHPVTCIGSGAFDDSSYTLALQSVSIPSTVTVIENSAFENSYDLQSVSIPSSVTSIGDSAFSTCTSLKKISIPMGVSAIGANTFYACSALTEVTLPSSLTSIGEWAFGACSDLTSITIPGAVTQIGADAFNGCISLTSVTLPAKVTIAAARLFCGCSNLTEVTLPASLTSVAVSAFQDCPALSTVNINSKAVTVDPAAFSGSDNIKDIIFAGSKAAWSSNPKPSGALIWCLESNDVLGDIVGSLEISSTSAAIYRGQTTPIDLRAEFKRPIPQGAKLPVSVALTGLDTKDATSLNFDSTKSSAVLSCTLAQNAGNSVSASIPTAGGQNFTAVQWTSNVAAPPAITIQTVPNTTAAPKESVRIDVSCSNLPQEGVSGTLTLSGFAVPSVDFALSSGASSQSLTAAIADNASTAEIVLSALRVGTVEITPPEVQHSLTVEAPQASATPTASPAPSASAPNASIAPSGPSSLPVTSPPPASSLPTSPAFSSPPAVLPSAGPSLPPEAVPSADSSQLPATGAPIVPTANPSTGPATSLPVSFPSASSTTSAPASSVPTLSSAAPIVSSSASAAPPQPSASAPASASSSAAIPVASKPAAAMPSGLPSSAAASSSPAGSAEPSSSESAAEASSSAGSSESLAPASESYAPVSINPSASDAPADLAVVPNPDGDGTVLTGAPIGSLWTGATVSSLLGWIALPDPGAEVHVLDADGQAASPDAQLATGMVVEVTGEDDDVLQESTVVIAGDVTGSGETGLTQLARVASALIGTDPLHGVYLLAADMNSSGHLTLTDAVQLARIYQEGSLQVDFVVTDELDPEILTQTGYDLEPWTDRLAVLDAGIPEDVPIESITWTQHDYFPDGSEQEVCSGGLYSSLVFGAYDNGRTVITAEVTTEAGRTGSTDTEIDWQAGRAKVGGRNARLEIIDTGFRKDAQKDITKASSSASPKPSASADPTPTPPPHVTLPPAEQLLTYRLQAVAAVNELRETWRIHPDLERNAKLAQAAMVRAEEMAAAGKLSHTRPDGSKFSTVVDLGKGTVVGENIHCNKGYPDTLIAKTAAKCWENSAPHRKQMLEPRYKYTGLGFAEAADGTWYCVELFSNGDDVISIDSPVSAKPSH